MSDIHGEAFGFPESCTGCSPPPVYTVPSHALKHVMTTRSNALTPHTDLLHIIQTMAIHWWEDSTTSNQNLEQDDVMQRTSPTAF